MFNCALILIKFICHTSRSQAVCSQINVIRPEQELKHHTLVPDRYIWISNWISHQTNKISKTFLISMAPEARLAASAIGHRGQSQRWVAVFHLSLCKFLERSSKHKEENDKKSSLWLLEVRGFGSGSGFHSFLPLPLLVLQLKNHVRHSQCPLCRRDAITHFPAGSTAVHITATSHVQIITTHMHYYLFFPFFLFSYTRVHMVCQNGRALP